MKLTKAQFVQAFPNLSFAERVFFDALLDKAFPAPRAREKKAKLSPLDEIEQEARRLMALDQKINAIKHLRESSRIHSIGVAMTARYGWPCPLGLWEAKQYAEKFPSK